MKPAGYYRATKQDDKINEYYDAEKQGTLDALKAAYDTQTSGYGRAAENLKSAYDSARNTTSADSAIANYNLNQRLAGGNVNSGAGAQARLSQQNALTRRYSELDKQNLDSQRELETEQANLQRQYQAGIADAIHKNEMNRAKALYDEAVRYDNSFKELPVAASGGGRSGGYTTSQQTAGMTGSTLDVAQNLALAKQSGASAREILEAIGAEHSAGNISNIEADEITRQVLNQKLGDTSSWNAYSPLYWQMRTPR